MAMRLGQRQLDAATTAVQTVMAVGQTAISTRGLRDHFKESGREDQVPALDQRLLELKQVTREIGRNSDFFMLVTLPVPSMQEEFVTAIGKDEMALIRRYAVIRRESDREDKTVPSPR